MEANTLQVRKVMRNAIKLHNAQLGFYNWSWTDKTTVENTARRSVVFNVSKADAVLATVQAEFAKLGYTNTVKVTCGTYLRCIANKA